MSNAALIDEKGNVLEVIVVEKDAPIAPDGTPIALQGMAVTLGKPQYVMTNYNGVYRGKYAGIGDTYDTMLDIFVSPSVPAPKTSSNTTIAS